MTGNNVMESEALLLGAVLLDAGKAREVLDGLRESDFALEINRNIFAAICRIDSRNEIIDPVKVLQESKAERQYLFELMDIAPAGAVDLAGHIERVHKAAQARQVREALEKADLMLNDGTDTAEVIDSMERTLDEIGKAADGELMTGEAAALEFWNRLDMCDLSVQTGFGTLDQTLGGGMLNSGLYVLAARPGCGKTALALQIADQAAKDGGVLFISLEMDSVQLTARRVSRLCRIPASKLLLGGATEDEIAEAAKAGRKLVDVPLYLNKKLRCGVADIRAMARKVKDLRLVVIDYLQLLRLNPRLKSRYEQVTEVSGELKMLARTLGVPVLCLAQLNRGTETRGDKRPMLADLRDSGAIEQDADAVIFLHRPDMYDEEEKTEWVQVGVIVAKNRHAATGEIDMILHLASGEFREVDKRYVNL